MEDELFEKIEVKEINSIPEFDLDISNNKAVAILGNPNSAKTNLLIYLANKVNKKKKYLLGYPREIKGYKILNDLEDLNKIDNCVLCIDEITHYIRYYDRKSNEKLMDLLAMCEHFKIKLIFTTQISQSITKQVEALIPCYAICQINTHTLKNGSMPKLAIRSIKHPAVSPFGLKLEVGQFIWYDMFSKEAGTNKIYTFPFQHIGKDWGISNTSIENSEENVTKKNEENILKVNDKLNVGWDYETK